MAFQGAILPSAQSSPPLPARTWRRTSRRRSCRRPQVSQSRPQANPAQPQATQSAFKFRATSRLISHQGRPASRPMPRSPSQQMFLAPAAPTSLSLGALTASLEGIQPSALSPQLAQTRQLILRRPFPPRRQPSVSLPPALPTHRNLRPLVSRLHARHLVHFHLPQLACKPARLRYSVLPCASCPARQSFGTSTAL